MLLFGEWYLLLYVYIVLQVLLHILTHTIIISRSVLSPSQMLLQDIIQIMCDCVHRLLVIEYYMDCIIKYMPYVNIVNGVLTSIDQLLELMIRTSMHQIHNKLEHKYVCRALRNTHERSNNNVCNNICWQQYSISIT